MTDTHREWTDRLSEYMAGELDARDFRAVEQHLGECGPCRRVLEELRDVIMRAAALDDLQPPRDLWAGIAATIQAPVPAEASAEAKVIALPTTGSPMHDIARTPSGRWTRIAFTPPQLAAASIVLVAISVGATWMAGPGLGAAPSLPIAVAVPEQAVSMVADVPGPPEGLAAELSALEEALVAARSLLDPNTVRALERNLSVIEMAIEDSRLALAKDPGNGFLADHLDRVYRRKLTYLRDAARVAEWAS